MFSMSSVSAFPRFFTSSLELSTPWPKPKPKGYGRYWTLSNCPLFDCSSGQFSSRSMMRKGNLLPQQELANGIFTTSTNRGVDRNAALEVELQCIVFRAVIRGLVGWRMIQIKSLTWIISFIGKMYNSWNRLSSSANGSTGDGAIVLPEEHLRQSTGCTSPLAPGCSHQVEIVTTVLLGELHPRCASPFPVEHPRRRKELTHDNSSRVELLPPTSGSGVP